MLCIKKGTNMEKNEFFKQYQTEKWYKLSKRIKARDRNTCQMCGRNDLPLSVHHLYYPENGDISDIEDSSLITLCDNCHYIQSKSKRRVHQILKELRLSFTDYEIYCSLKSLLQGKFCQTPYSHISLEAKEEVSYHGEKLPLLENLDKWRKHITESYNNEEQG